MRACVCVCVCVCVCARVSVRTRVCALIVCCLFRQVEREERLRKSRPRSRDHLVFKEGGEPIHLPPLVPKVQVNTYCMFLQFVNACVIASFEGVCVCCVCVHARSCRPGN